MPAQNPHFKKVLIINIFGIGDVLFSTPLISNIKAAFPDCFIGYICNKRAAPLLSANPKINKIFLYERDEFNRVYAQSKIAFLKKMTGILGEIRREKFDVVIDLSLNTHAQFLMWFLGIKTRIGFNYKNRSPLLNHPVKLEGYEGRHVVDYYLSLLDALGIPKKNNRMELIINDSDKDWAAVKLSDFQIKKNDFLVAVVPGGGASWGKDANFKRWSTENYAQLADKMIEKFSAKVILLGDSFEEELCRRVMGAMHKSANIVCGVSLGQFAAILSMCKLALVNDGGPLHVAVAVSTRTASIFGPVDERVYGPYPQGRHIIIKKNLACQPCYRRFKLADCRHHNCLNSLSVNEVMTRLEQSL